MKQQRQTSIKLWAIQNVPREKFNILGGHSISHSKQNSVYVHVFHSERFPR
jgi:hypothetical protein